MSEDNILSFPDIKKVRVEKRASETVGAHIHFLNKFDDFFLPKMVATILTETPDEYAQLLRPQVTMEMGREEVCLGFVHLQKPGHNQTFYPALMYFRIAHQDFFSNLNEEGWVAASTIKEISNAINTIPLSFCPLLNAVFSAIQAQYDGSLQMSTNVELRCRFTKDMVEIAVLLDTIASITTLHLAHFVDWRNRYINHSVDLFAPSPFVKEC